MKKYSRESERNDKNLQYYYKNRESKQSEFLR